MAFQRFNHKNSLSNIIIICGPTASGKSKFALRLASRHGGVIVNADAMQVYRGISIITACPTEKECVPHYLYNFVDPSLQYSVMQYINDLHQTLLGIKSNIVIIVGGSGLYINSILQGISIIPDIPQDVLQYVKDRFDTLGKMKFYELLLSLDKTAAHIMPSDKHRMIRAFAVKMHTGNSLVDYYSTRYNPFTNYNINVVMLYPERELLYELCNKRFLEFIQNGAVEEVRALCEHQVSDSVMKIIGVREFMSYLEHSLSMEEAVQCAQARTRWYAKRQITWFKHQIKDKEVIEYDSVDILDHKIESFVCVDYDFKTS